MFRIASLLRRTAGFTTLVTCIGISVANGAAPSGRGADSPNAPADFTKTTCAECTMSARNTIYRL